MASSGKIKSVSNEEILKTTSLPSIESNLLQLQLRWAGHITSMKDARMPKAAFFSELIEGKRDRGAPRKRYKHELKKGAARVELAISHGTQEASGRDSWRSSARKASHTLEAERHGATKERRRRQKK